MIGIIEIEDMEFFAYHGCFEAEQIVGNKFKVYACLHYECEGAALSDDIHQALNYQEAYQLIAHEMSINSHLLEHLAKRIMDGLYVRFPELQYAKIKISKLNPPLGGKIGATSVSLEK
jgi:dihydroneopterin aldolase